MRNSIAALGLTLVGASMLAGCRTLAPYESRFMCEGSEDFGQCMNVQRAYDTAVQGEAANGAPRAPLWEYTPSRDRRARKPATPDARELRAPESAQPLRIVDASVQRTAFTPREGADLYREMQYREMAGLIEAPVTPLVKAPTVLRTLVVSYTAERTLFMPRYVYYFADEARFVMGETLNAAGSLRTVYPNGTPATSASSVQPGP